MFRFVKLWIPPDTPKSDPVTKTIQLTEGVITNWWVGFPDGCADYVHCAVYEFEHQILPRGEDEDLFWNDYVFPIPEHYELTDEPYEIEVRAWSEDDSYDQYVVVGVVLEELVEVTLADLYRALKEFLKAMVTPTE